MTALYNEIDPKAAAQAFIEAYLGTLDLRLTSGLTTDEGDIFS